MPYAEVCEDNKGGKKRKKKTIPSKHEELEQVEDVLVSIIMTGMFVDGIYK